MAMDIEVEIDAPAARVWAVCTDVLRWPEWTESVESITPLDGPALAVGSRFAIKQPRFPRLTWVVTELDEGRSWTWEQRSFGSRAIATHELTAVDEGRTRVVLRVEQGGPVGAVVGLMTRRLTRRYVATEAAGLKARCELGAESA